jgi:glutaconate CoA-transferase, subunit A
MPVISVAEAERRLRGVRSVALGGMLLENRPSTLVRALVRSGAGDLFICSAPAASWDADLLIGTGQATTVRIPHISLAGLGLAPATRRAAAAGTVTFQECDEALLLGGYLAAANHATIQVLDNMGTNDLVDDNSLVVHSGELTGVAPLRVEVALLHAQLGDEAGNLVYFGSRWADLLMARSATVVIAQVDRVVSTSETARLGVAIPGYLVDDVVEAPYGAHPLGSPGAYTADLEHLAYYQAEVLAGRFDEYVERYCRIDHDGYLAALSTSRRRELALAAC